MRPKLANALVKLAYWIDPKRPSVIAKNGQFEVEIGGLQLAYIRDRNFIRMRV